MIINKYTYRIDSVASFNVLSETKEGARGIIERFFTKKAKIELISEEFSHNSEDYKVERVPMSGKTVIKWGEEKTGIDSVVKVFGERMGKVSL